MKNTHRLRILSLLIPAFCFCSCTQNAVNDSTFKIQGAKLRTNGAFKTQLLMTGTRTTAGPNSFTNYKQLRPIGEFQGKVTVSMKVDQVKGLKGKLTAQGIPYVTAPEVVAEGTNKQSGTFVVVAVNEKEQLLRELQKPENAHLVRMLSRQREPRIVTAVATTLKHKNEVKNELGANAAVDLKVVGAPGGSVGIELKTTNNATFEFSDNTVFAYEMSIPGWQRDQSGKLYVVDYVEDRVGGRHPKLIDGAFENPAEAPRVSNDQLLLVDH